ncbi:putative S-locus glycoprotein [Helianthus annuus]|nr:putative S-locus glycoprotein [Helianthus annuus]
MITPGGKHEVWHLNRKTGKWTQDLSFPSDKCDGYGVCGPYGICSTDTYNICGCFKGFEPKNPQEMPQDNWSSGCRRTRSLDCSAEEGFQKFSSLKLPDTQNAMYDSHMSLHECCWKSELTS